MQRDNLMKNKALFTDKSVSNVHSLKTIKTKVAPKKQKQAKRKKNMKQKLKSLKPVVNSSLIGQGFSFGLENGLEGTGYTYTGGKGGYAIKAMVEHDLAPAIMGKDGTDIEGIYDFMEWHIHYVGRGGIASFAISTIVIALWDIRCKVANKPLWLSGG